MTSVVKSIRWCAALLTIFVLSACSEHANSRVHELSGPTMGTRYSVKLVDKRNVVNLDALARDIVALLEEIDASMSTYRPDSQLSQFNSSVSTDWFDTSEEMHLVLSAAQQISHLTNGAFDVTVGPLVNLWGFGPHHVRDYVPLPADIARALQQAGFNKIALRTTPAGVRKSRGDVYVDLSGIAKGYAVDRVAQLLNGHDIDNYLVEVGGELRASGYNARGEPWTIAIERPLVNQRSAQRLIYVQDLAVATSGNYRNYFERDGQRYSHAIDPRTGEPVNHQLVSVTVVAPSAMNADALATAFLVLGPDAGFELAAREKMAVLFISENGQGFSERHTTRFDRLLEMP